MSDRRNHPFLPWAALLLASVEVGFISGKDGRYTLRGKVPMGIPFHGALNGPLRRRELTGAFMASSTDDNH